MEFGGGHPWGKEGAALNFDSSCTVAPKLHSGWLYGAKLHTLRLIMGPRTIPLLSSCALLPFYVGYANLKSKDQEENSVYMWLTDGSIKVLSFRKWVEQQLKWKTPYNGQEGSKLHANMKMWLMLSQKQTNLSFMVKCVWNSSVMIK